MPWSEVCSARVTSLLLLLLLVVVVMMMMMMMMSSIRATGCGGPALFHSAHHVISNTAVGTPLCWRLTRCHWVLPSYGLINGVGAGIKYSKPFVCICKSRAQAEKLLAETRRQAVRHPSPASVAFLASRLLVLNPSSPSPNGLRYAQQERHDSQDYTSCN